MPRDLQGAQCRDRKQQDPNVGKYIKARSEIEERCCVYTAPWKRPCDIPSFLERNTLEKRRYNTHDERGKEQSSILKHVSLVPCCILSRKY